MTERLVLDFKFIHSLFLSYRNQTLKINNSGSNLEGRQITRLHFGINEAKGCSNHTFPPPRHKINLFNDVSRALASCHNVE